MGLHAVRHSTPTFGNWKVRITYRAIITLFMQLFKSNWHSWHSFLRPLDLRCTG